MLKTYFDLKYQDLFLIHIKKLTKKTPMAAPAVNNVTIWMVLMQSLPVNLEKFQNDNAITKKAITIPLNGDLCLMII